ncbi:MAG: 5-(carboxyamino)imidazole ribonucleotide synthase [Phycisphaerales bacterium]
MPNPPTNPPPGAVRTIGIIGGGQLGRMLALAGIPMGFRFVFLDSAPDACAGQVGDLIVADYTDHSALDHLAQRCDVVTCEFENVPGSALRRLNERIPVRPSHASFEAAQDRLAERHAFAAAEVPVAPFAPIDNLPALHRAASEPGVGTPGILKARHGGYDGKGQARLRTPDDAEQAWDAIGRAPAIYERMIPFTREVSIIGVRSLDGQFRAYPMCENTHRDGILHATRIPASEGRHDPALQGRAERRVRLLMESLGHIGVLTVEFFLIESSEPGAEPRLIANEFAPRVHNSGHWTIEGAPTSQFANHIRAITGLPLGDTGAPSTIAPIGMLNCIGRMPDRTRTLEVPALAMHDYDKPPRPGRKVGHLTLRADTPAQLHERMDACERLLKPASRPTAPR